MSNDKVQSIMALVEDLCGWYLTAATDGKEYARKRVVERRAALESAIREAIAAPGVAQGWKLLKDTTHEERSWPDDASHENGVYHCHCVNCGRMFVGHKRRVVCKVCAAPPTTEQPVTIKGGPAE